MFDILGFLWLHHGNPQYLLYLLEKLVDGLSDERMKPPHSTDTTTLLGVVIGMNQSFNMEPATVNKQSVPPCDQITKEQQVVVGREEQGVKSKSVQKAPVYSAEQRNCLKSARLRNVIDMIQFGDIKACSENAYHFSLNYQARRFSMALINFVDQLNAPSFDGLTSSSFPSLTDFSSAATADALKWTDLEQNVVYQIVSTRTVNTQHGQSVILSPQKAGGSSCSVWACGMLAKELLHSLRARSRTCGKAVVLSKDCVEFPSRVRNYAKGGEFFNS